ncbi:glycosyltransferase family 4 protein [Chloroflexota bacterium]
MKHILIFAGYFYPHLGGYENNVRELASRLSKLGYSVEIITDNTESTISEEILDGFTVYRLPCWNILGGTYPIILPYLQSFRIIRRIWQKQYDVIITNTRFFLTSLSGAILSRLKNIPLIHIERGSHHSITNRRLVNWLSKLYDHTLGSWIVKQAQLNIGVSNAAADFVRHLGASRIQILPNGIDTTIYKRKETDMRQVLNIGVKDPLLVYVGRVIYAKGVQDFICVLPALKKRYPKIKLLVAGKGNYQSILQKQAERLECQNSVKFLGELSRKQIVDLLSTADIFVNPSYSEGLPTSVMEAASVGLSIIASDAGGTRDIIADGNTGLLFSIGNTDQLEVKLDLLLSDLKLRNKLGSRASTFIKEYYDWNTIIYRLQKQIEVLNAH